MSDVEVIPPKSGGDVVDVATDRVTLFAVGGALLENLTERTLFKALPQFFGYALGDKNGNVTFHAAKINPAGTGNGRPTYVPQTAQSSTPLFMRQGARVVIGGVGFALGIAAKDKATRAAGMTAGVLAAAHIVQDFIPPLRG
jgi:hypothetical protein